MSTVTGYTFATKYNSKASTTPKKAGNPLLKGVKVKTTVASDGKSATSVLSKGDGYDSYLDFFKIVNPNSLEGELDKEAHTRDMFAYSIEDPINFIKDKDVARKDFKTRALEIRKMFFSEFVGLGIPPLHAEKMSSVVGKGLYELLIKVLDEDLYPSKLEGDIMSRRYAKVKDQLSNPLDKKVNEKL